MQAPASRSSSPRVPLGQWRLHAGCAMRLRPRGEAVLRVYRGRLWVTLGRPDGGTPEHSGDLFVAQGQTLVVPVGARCVLEPWPAGPDADPVCFDWMDLQPADPQAGRFAREVLRPSREAWDALGLAAGATARVLRGLLGYGEYLVAGRGRVLSPLESMRS